MRKESDFFSHTISLLPMRNSYLFKCLCLLATIYLPFIWNLSYLTQKKKIRKAVSNVHYPMNSDINQEPSIVTTRNTTTDDYFDSDSNEHYPTPFSIQGEEAPVVEAWKVFSCKELKVAKEPPSTINFFASAVGLDNYEMVLPMYVFFALSSHRNVDAVAEIIVPDAKAFIKRTEKVLAYLQSTFSTPKHAALCVREYTGQPRKRTTFANTWRYFEVPRRFSAKYTYIGDVDIFILSSVLVAGRFKQMSEFNLPYSDVIRDYDTKEPRLTGVMLVETARFYTDKLRWAQANLNALGNDEHFLYRIVKGAGL